MKPTSTSALRERPREKSREKSRRAHGQRNKSLLPSSVTHTDKPSDIDRHSFLNSTQRILVNGISQINQDRDEAPNRLLSKSMILSKDANLTMSSITLEKTGAIPKHNFINRGSTANIKHDTTRIVGGAPSNMEARVSARNVRTKTSRNHSLNDRLSNNSRGSRKGSSSRFKIET